MKHIKWFIRDVLTLFKFKRIHKRFIGEMAAMDSLGISWTKPKAQEFVSFWFDMNRGPVWNTWIYRLFIGYCKSHDKTTETSNMENKVLNIWRRSATHKEVMQAYKEGKYTEVNHG